MDTETIKNPDALIGPRPWATFKPVFSHVEVVHDPPLRESDNPVVSRLLESGFEVHETHSTFYMGFPTPAYKLAHHFVGQKRDEFQIRLGDDGWLRWRFEGPEEVYLTLLYIHFNQQGRGKGRFWFPRVTDALFRSGVSFMYGIVAPSYYRSKWPMNVRNAKRLIDFYVREGFSSDGDGYVWKDSPYEDSNDSDDGWADDDSIGAQSVPESMSVL